MLLHQTFILPDWFTLRRGVCRDFQHDLFIKRWNSPAKSTLQRYVDQ
ncbi:hypothetical protein RESH_01322 [Rhodopirellula europaea SH398]|uniref:Uncharacterized protein n=1 Tax=Rhodopirellula europaea SH398 TaxID=1263868 RepID=M5S9D8_9BACT|nr:hypothetical protein RESH_01322 [Rhodopirellula europaea SH398]